MAGKKIKKPVRSFSKPPVVAVVGHIDHGKTSLLDKIRETKIAFGESGGITQHIGASQISIKTKEGKERKITFIDTPGHAAFTQMRARGVRATDLVVLVVAADSGVQEQTKESLNHIKAAKSTFLIAVNKIDLSTADVEKVKAQLAEIDVIPEDYGGKIVVLPVSAKTGQGIDELLEMILLLADLEELKADPRADFQGVVIESTLDSRRGPVATILVNAGTLKVGEEIFAEKVRAKIKAMRNWLGRPVKEAFPGDPVEILGLEKVPLVGSPAGKSPLELEKTEVESPETGEGVLKLIIKADVQGSLEAILANLPEKVELIHSGVGEITESDLFLSQTSGADIFGFNVKVSLAGKRIIEQSGVKIFLGKIIYEILEEIEKRIEKKINPLAGKEISGQAEVIAEFEIKGKRIAGCRVIEGRVFKGRKCLLTRKKEVLGEAMAVSMKHLKDDVEEAEKGQEFGLILSPQLDFKLGDVISSYSDAKTDEGRRSDSESQQPDSEQR